MGGALCLGPEACPDRQGIKYRAGSGRAGQEGLGRDFKAVPSGLGAGWQQSQVGGTVRRAVFDGAAKPAVVVLRGQWCGEGRAEVSTAGERVGWLWARSSR